MISINENNVKLLIFVNIFKEDIRSCTNTIRFVLSRIFANDGSTPIFSAHTTLTKLFPSLTPISRYVL